MNRTVTDYQHSRGFRPSMLPLIVCCVEVHKQEALRVASKKSLFEVSYFILHTSYFSSPLFGQQGVIGEIAAEAFARCAHRNGFHKVFAAHKTAFP